MLNLLHNLSMAAGSEEGGHELPNALTIVQHFTSGSSFAEFLHKYEALLFSLIIAAVIIVIARLASRNPRMIPRGLQNVVEMIVEALTDFVVGILGERGRKFVPFIGTLFIYIYFMNIFGLIPFGKSPTASINQTLALALCVFIYVQITGFKELGVKGYIDHMMGQPRSAMQWAFVPLMLPIHLIGEVAKPMSLSLRLFGNVTGEDILIFIFVGLGVTVMSFMKLPIGLPLHVPFLFLALLTSFIQALVFMLLSTIYFSMMLPHDEEHH